MTIQYVGKNNEWYRNKKPMAIISYDEKREESKADKVIEGLQEKGWNPVCESEMIVISVMDKDEYGLLVNDYKELKQTVSKLKK